MECGFVLVTVLVMLALLTLLSLTMYFSGRVATQSSQSAQDTTEGYYYAETAVNYMTWAMANDAEFDSHVYTGTYIHGRFPEPPNIPSQPSFDPTKVGDYKELRAYLWNPGPTAISDTGKGITGQVMYFDNSPMNKRVNKRAICFQNAAIHNCIDVSLSPGGRFQPTMYHISAKLPRYIKLDMASDGTISPSIPELPHHKLPVVGQDIPKNGAIVWITAGDPNNNNHDMEIFPLDPASIYGGIAPQSCAGGVLPSCPCNSAVQAFATAQACDANSGQWLPSYNIVVYAIGYVNGRPSHLLRAVIK